MKKTRRQRKIETAKRLARETKKSLVIKNRRQGISFGGYNSWLPREYHGFEQFAQSLNLSEILISYYATNHPPLLSQATSSPYLNRLAQNEKHGRWLDDEEFEVWHGRQDTPEWIGTWYWHDQLCEGGEEEFNKREQLKGWI